MSEREDQPRSQRVEEVAAALLAGMAIEDVAQKFAISISTVEWYVKYSVPSIKDHAERKALHKRQCREYLQDLIREHRGYAVAILKKGQSAVGNRQSVAKRRLPTGDLPTALLQPETL